MRKKPIFSLDPDQLECLLSIGTGGQDVVAGPERQADDSGDGKRGGNAASGEQPPPHEEDPSANITASLVGMEQRGGRVGRYKLLHVLGEGGMGVVYLAEQEQPIRRRVALKLIKPGMDSARVIARFEAERQALALLDHSNIAHVHDAGTTDSGRPYFVMEYVRGSPITEYCDQRTLSIEDRLLLFRQVCDAMQHAHQKGIIHRDIKPSNILVLEEQDKTVPKVIDFGVAKAVSQPLTERTVLTEDTQLLGTPEYMSPEQADMATEDIDTRSDIYSLGVLLYVLLTGVMPFDPETFRKGGIDHMRRVICQTDPETPSSRLMSLGENARKLAESRGTEVGTLAKRLHRELEWIPLKAMRKERSERYRSASELADDIENYLEDAPLIAGPPGTVYRLKKFGQRHGAFVTGAAAVLIVLAGGIFVSTFFAIRAERSRSETAAVAQFLQEDVFGAIDPYSRGSQQVPVKEILDAASQKIPSKFGNTPLHEASIRRTLGALYWKVDECEEAEHHLRRSLEIFTREQGSQDARTIEVVDQLGRLCWAQWRYTEAEHYLSDALRGKRHLLGSNHADTVDAMGWLGWAYSANGRPKKAESLLAEAYNTARRTLGASDRMTLECMYRYGGALLLRGRYDEAERMLGDALERWQEALIPVDPFMVYHAALLGRLYNRKGQYEEAEEILGKALATSRNEWPEHSSATCHCVAALAENYARQGRIDEAEALLLDAVRRGQGTDEPRPEIPLETKPYLGFFYMWQRRYDDAEGCVKEALRVSLDCYGEQHPITLMGMTALGMVYRGQGRHDEAETQLAKAVDIARHYCGDESVRTADVMHQLATLYQKQGKYTEAEKLHLKVLDIRRNLLVENHPHTLGTVKGLIALYAAWGKPQEARKWFGELEKAYTHQSADHQYTRTKGSVNYDPMTETYTPTAAPLAPWAIEKELDFSYPEPSSEMWHVCDELHFAHKTLDGDGSITVRIKSVEHVHECTKAGLMIRNTLGPASENAAVCITPTGRVVFQHRVKQLGAMRSIFADVNNVTLPHWVRLTRKGKRFTAQHSSDGVNWEKVQGSDLNEPTSIAIPMNEEVHIGLAVMSNSTTRTAEARISNVTVIGSVTADVPFTISEDVGLHMNISTKE